jgi:predicted nucleic acid-binding protein
VTIYFDTSALLAIYVEQRTSRAARRAYCRARAVATSYLTYAETLAALRALVRKGALPSACAELAASRFVAAWPSLQRVVVDARVVSEVRRLLVDYPLKGADAVQLASAALVQRRCEAAGLSAELASDDRTLRRSALSEGLSLAW